MSVCTLVLTLPIAISLASPLAHMVFVKLSHSGMACQPPPSPSSAAPRPPRSPLVWSRPPLHITSHSSLYLSVHCLIWLSRRIDTRSAGRLDTASRQNNTPTKRATLLEKQTLKEKQDSWTKWELRANVCAAGTQFPVNQKEPAAAQPSCQHFKTYL